MLCCENNRTFRHSYTLQWHLIMFDYNNVIFSGGKLQFHIILFWVLQYIGIVKNFYIIVIFVTSENILLYKHANFILYRLVFRSGAGHSFSTPGHSRAFTESLRAFQVSKVICPLYKLSEILQLIYT